MVAAAHWPTDRAAALFPTTAAYHGEPVTGTVLTRAARVASVATHDAWHQLSYRRYHQRRALREAK